MAWVLSEKPTYSIELQEKLFKGNVLFSHKNIKSISQLQFRDTPDLVIIDAINNDFELIKVTKNALTFRFLLQQTTPPDFIAIINSEYNHKKQLFDIGITDYISCPFISKEINYRIMHILHSNEKIKNTHQSNESLSAQTYKNNNLDSMDSQLILIEKCIKHLNSTISEDVRLETLCRLLGTNRNKLNQVFKDHLGMTVFEWLRKQRMYKAAELLETSSLNIVQIAEKVGYMDSNNFSTAFKRIYHNCPSQFRKQFKSSIQN
ncbi:helix-turn-helix domain-containing protein [Photobacterium halotolerans]|uniref:helix-turn-helix domain-containing protein n=1 Tax=Photobacterium halotolerans TaxID=265726 RepID=UPI00040F5CB3|nr:AraC family transcriptional regulator [Photobacterium halotolerans]